MEPNGREKVPCKVCGKLIFFALTGDGEWLALDVKPDPVRGSVAAYRHSVRRWYARSLLAEAGEHPAHPLERRFIPHPLPCRRRQGSTQPTIPGLVIESPLRRPAGPAEAPAVRSGNVIPFRRRRT